MKKTKRTLEEVKLEHQKVMLEIGLRDYKKRVLEMELQGLAKVALDLNMEADKLKEKK